MVHLFDTPPEIYQQVVHELVSSTGVRNGWKYRGVCRTFATEIAADIFIKQPQAAFLTHGVEDFVQEYLHLFIGMKKDRGHVDFKPDFIIKINQMVDYLVTELGSRSSRRDSIMLRICDGLKVVVSQEDIFRAFMTTGPVYGNYHHSGAWFTVLNGPFDASIKLVAAVLNRSAGLVRQLLPHLPDLNKHPIFGSPLINAIKLRDENMVNVFIQYLQSFHLSTNLSRANRQKKRDFLTNRNSAFPVCEAVRSAILFNHHNIFRALVELFKNEFGEAENKFFSMWLETAATHSSTEFVRDLFTIPRKDSFMVGFKTWTAACKTGDYALVSAIVNNTTGPFTHLSSEWHPFHIAVRTGHIDSVRAFIQSGHIDINERVNCTFKAYLGGNTQQITSLDVAIHQKCGPMVKYLLEHGADYRRSFPPRYLTGQTYNYLRDKAMKDNNGFTTAPEYGHYENMSWPQRLQVTFG